ncbi:unnamed protein product [Polarella glacialis]|uniref:RING-type domain-containing protein n=1 Tax=Polarella glacialis TaxID=89957 RepID=A0A813HG51_POLGL|nr:unnamed protein product [Polarella glacialis]
MSDDELVYVFPGLSKGKGKGKGKGKRSSGKGKGRTGNPIGPDGNTMRCRTCNSTEHFQRECPTATPQNMPPPSRAFLAAEAPDSFASVGPLAGVLSSIFMVNTEDAEPDAGRVIPVPAATAGWHSSSVSDHSVRTDPWVHVDPWQQQQHQHEHNQQLPYAHAFDYGPSLGTYVSPAFSMHDPAAQVPALPQPPVQRPSLPPPEVPAWSNLPAFSMNVHGGSMHAPGDVLPNFPGAAGGPNTRHSTLDSQQHIYIDQLHHTSTSLQQWYEEHIPLVPVVLNQSTLPQDQHPFINEFFQIQQGNADRAHQRKGKGKGKGRRDRTIVDYDGADQTCTLCLEDFSDGEAVLRLVCRHCFHIDCWNHMLSTYDEEDMECPNCRGSARVIARFRFLAPDVVSYERTPVRQASASHHNMTTGSTPRHSQLPSRDPSPASSGYVSTSSTVLPWWPASATDVTSVLHSATRLADGRMSIIVDPGAWTNLAGARFSRMQAQRAVAAGHTPSQSPMTRPLQIQGVGNGVQSAKWQTELPIAVPNTDGTATLHRFETPTVEGSGEDLPALLGLRSIRSKQGVLETAEGKERLSFPGPGGYSIEWSPGTLHFDLEVAPSGHYVIPCDSFDLLPNTAAGGSGGLPPASVVLHSHHSAPAPSTFDVHDPSASSSASLPLAPVTHQAAGNASFLAKKLARSP